MAPMVYYAPSLSRIAARSVCGDRPLVTSTYSRQQAARIVIQGTLWSPGTWYPWRALNPLHPYQTSSSSGLYGK